TTAPMVVGRCWPACSARVTQARTRLLTTDADLVAGAECGQASQTRSAQHNGYRHRELDTRVGAIDAAVQRRTGGAPSGDLRGEGRPARAGLDRAGDAEWVRRRNEHGATAGIDADRTGDSVSVTGSGPRDEAAPRRRRR